MKDPGDNNGDNSKIEQTSNPDKSVDDESEDSIVFESNLSNDEVKTAEHTVTTSEDTLTTDTQASKGDLTSSNNSVRNLE